MQDDNYDVSVFIIDKDNNYITLEEYEAYEYKNGMFVCLTNDELNSDYGFNNSICIYKEWRDKVDKAKEILSETYGVKYEHGNCKWQIDNIEIPNNERFRANVIQTDSYKQYKELKHYLDGYLSSQNIMSNVTIIKGKYKKENYIPAIMTAYYTKIEHNEKVYSGYLPSIGQLIYISENIDNVYNGYEALKIMVDVRLSQLLGYWWSSSVYYNDIWDLSHGKPEHSKKSEYIEGVLPLFAL